MNPIGHSCRQKGTQREGGRGKRTPFLVALKVQGWCGQYQVTTKSLLSVVGSLKKSTGWIQTEPQSDLVLSEDWESSFQVRNLCN